MSEIWRGIAPRFNRGCRVFHGWEKGRDALRTSRPSCSEPQVVTCSRLDPRVSNHGLTPIYTDELGSVWPPLPAADDVEARTAKAALNRSAFLTADAADFTDEISGVMLSELPDLPVKNLRS